MADYTPTTDVFARFIEGLKFGQGLKAKEQENALQAMQVQKLQEDMARAKRTENLDFTYGSGGGITSGEEFDIAQKLKQGGAFEPRRDIPITPNAAQPSTFTPEGIMQFAKANGGFPTRAEIPADETATGLAGYNVPSNDINMYMQNAPKLDQYQAGLEALSKPAGLGAQIDPMTGKTYLPGRKRTDKPTIIETPANPTVVEFDGKKFVQYTNDRGTNFASIPDTPVAINALTGQAQELPRGGKLVLPPGAAASQETATRLNSLEQGVNLLENLLAKAPSGRIAGNFAQAANALGGWYPEARGAKDIGGLLAPMTTRLIGGDVGNLSIVEQQASKRLTETLVSATPEERKQALNIIRTLIKYRRIANDKKLTGGAFWNGASGALSELGMPSYDALISTLANPNVPLGKVAQVVKEKPAEVQPAPQQSNDLW